MKLALLVGMALMMVGCSNFDMDTRQSDWEFGIAMEISHATQKMYICTSSIYATLSDDTDACHEACNAYYEFMWDEQHPPDGLRMPTDLYIDNDPKSVCHGKLAEYHFVMPKVALSLPIPKELR